MMSDSDNRINNVLEVVSAYANLDFSKKAHIGNDHNLYDALSAGINMLGEELRESTVSLREKEALVKEVHHRVKNNLQIISSLLSLQANFVKEKGAREKFRESRERVRSMALIHEMLYLSKKISEVNFAEYIETLANSLFATYNISNKKIALKLNIDITDKFFDIDTAIPCGLIVNEIISNSFKYAFLKKKNGIISIQMKNTEPKNYCLFIEDNGHGFPKKVNLNSATFGLQLINTLAEQIKGEIQFETGKNGTKYGINFSLKK